MSPTWLHAVTKILDLPEGQEVAVVGTVYKEMKLKPSILSEYNKVGCHFTVSLPMEPFTAVRPPFNASLGDAQAGRCPVRS